MKQQQTLRSLSFVAALAVTLTDAFTVQNHRFHAISSLTKPHQNTPGYALQMSSSVMPSEPEKVMDNNGVEFTTDCTIQTCTEIKAFHVPRKGFGFFDEESKSFVAVESAADKDVAIGDIPRADRCLIIPQGMRGKVIRVYDMSEFDATAPILAKFQASEALDGDFAPPVTFLMHFETHEVEVV